MLCDDSPYARGGSGRSADLQDLSSTHPAQLTSQVFFSMSGSSALYILSNPGYAINLSNDPS